MKYFLLLLLGISLHSNAQSYDIEYKRTYNKIKSDNNELSLNITADGLMTIIYPSFNAPKSKMVKTVLTIEQLIYDELIDQVIAKKINPSVDRKLKVIKSDRSKDRFYSSEIDKHEIFISLNGQKLWQYEFYNWQELKHYYNQLGEWQPLVDLVNQIETIVVTNMKKMNSEVKK